MADNNAPEELPKTSSTSSFISAARKASAQAVKLPINVLQVQCGTQTKRTWSLNYIFIFCFASWSSWHLQKSASGIAAGGAAVGKTGKSVVKAPYNLVKAYV